MDGDYHELNAAVAHDMNKDQCELRPGLGITMPSTPSPSTTPPTT